MSSKEDNTGNLFFLSLYGLSLSIGALLFIQIIMLVIYLSKKLTKS